MGIKRTRATGSGIWKGAAAECAVLLLLTGVLAALLQKGIISFGELTPGLALLCIAAGSAGVLWGPKGERAATARLIACGIPALALLIADFLLPRENGMKTAGAINAGCLLLPCLVSLALGRRNRRRGAGGRRRRGKRRSG